MERVISAEGGIDQSGDGVLESEILVERVGRSPPELSMRGVEREVMGKGGASGWEMMVTEVLVRLKAGKVPPKGWRKDALLEELDFEVLELLLEERMRSKRENFPLASRYNEIEMESAERLEKTFSPEEMSVQRLIEALRL